MIAREVQNYIIESQIGEGGMATVYKARHKTLQNTYRAIKVLHPAMAMNLDLRQRFITEAQTIADLNHPNIVRMYDYAEEGNDLFLIMEYIQGHPLDELLRNVTGPLPEARIRTMMGAILDAFSYAHSRGLVHRDIKPSNIIIGADDVPKVIDFGIVRMLDATHPGHTQSSTKIGTVSFMSPEQILARGVDTRSDIYALGVTLFHMLTGRAPYDSGTLSEYEIQDKIVREPMPRAAECYPSVSANMQAVVDKATKKAKEDRFQNCGEFKAALFNIGALAGEGGVIHLFTADRDKISAGDGVELFWEVSGVESITISGVGTSKALRGTTRVFPKANNSYELIAGSEKQKLDIVVEEEPMKYVFVFLLGLLFFVIIIAWVLLSKQIDYSTNSLKFPPSNTAEVENADTVTNSPNYSTTSIPGAPLENPQSIYGMSFSYILRGSNGDTANQVISVTNLEKIKDRIMTPVRNHSGEVQRDYIKNLLTFYKYPVIKFYSLENAPLEKVRKHFFEQRESTLRAVPGYIENDGSYIMKNDDGNYVVHAFTKHPYYLPAIFYEMSKNIHSRYREYYAIKSKFVFDRKFNIIEEAVESKTIVTEPL